MKPTPAPRTSPLALSFLLAASALSAAASIGCDGNASETTTGTTTTEPATGGSGGDTGGSGGAGGTGGAGGSTEPPAPERKSLSGQVTWTVTFDDAAKAAGATDCTYTRSYTGFEDRSAQWLCPDCEIMFNVAVELTDGADDCFPQISANPPNAKEWLGYSNGVFRRGAGGPLTEQGSAMVSGDTIAWANKVEMLEAQAGGTFTFDVAGTLTTGVEVGDPMNGFVPPAMYTNGWPKADPPPYTGDYVLTKGGVLPDGFFKDTAQETVRLHDFKGSYLVVDMAAIDCPPCQSMAGEEEQFVQDMSAMGIEVHVVTLLCPSLTNVLGDTTTNQLKLWTNNYDLTSPVLADRGWGLSIFEPAIGADVVGYPSWAVVAPDLTVLEFATGYDSFQTMQDIILAHAQ